MTETIATTSAGDYCTQVRFERPPDAVFEALTTVPGLAAWWTTRVSGVGVEGGELRIAFPNSGYHQVVLAVETAERPHTVVWSVLAAPALPAWAEWPGTRIAVRLRADGAGGTTMDLHHEGLTPTLHCYELCSGGWDYVLASLHDHVDSGTGRPIS